MNPSPQPRRIECECKTTLPFEPGMEVVVRCADSWCDGETGRVVGEFVHGYVTVERDAGKPRFLAKPSQLRIVGEVVSS